MIAAFFLFSSFQKKHLTPLSFLKNEKTLVFIKSVFPKSFIDTLNSIDIDKLSLLQFEKKHFRVEDYGVTPDYSISVLHANDEDKRICLIAIWHIGNKKIAVNVNHLDKEKFYYGYVIDEQKFEALFSFKKFKEASFP